MNMYVTAYGHIAYFIVVVVVGVVGVLRLEEIFVGTTLLTLGIQS